MDRFHRTKYIVWKTNTTLVLILNELSKLFNHRNETKIMDIHENEKCSSNNLTAMHGEDPSSLGLFLLSPNFEFRLQPYLDRLYFVCTLTRARLQRRVKTRSWENESSPIIRNLAPDCWHSFVLSLYIFVQHIRSFLPKPSDRNRRGYYSGLWKRNPKIWFDNLYYFHSLIYHLQMFVEHVPSFVHQHFFSSV